MITHLDQGCRELGGVNLYLPCNLPFGIRRKVDTAEVTRRATGTIHSIFVGKPTDHIESGQYSLLTEPRPAKLPPGYRGRLGAGACCSAGRR
jgi:hypothetical protein